MVKFTRKGGDMMSTTGLREKIKEEINQIPDEHLAEVYDLFHNYSRSRQIAPKKQTIMDFAGAWRDMPDNLFADFSSDVDLRRRAAGKGRRDAR